MPKEDDYANTVIYKICCKDESIKDVYVGHTTNFNQRKYSHKIASNKLYNTSKIYNAIRSNGGWDNWDMIEIAKYNCKNVIEARIKENEHYIDLNATLNSCPPYSGKTQCLDKNTNNIALQNNGAYYCKCCNYTTPYSKDYNKHTLTKKHINNINSCLDNQNALHKKTYKCNKCSKFFNDRAGLWRHKKICTYKDENIEIINIVKDEERKQEQTKNEPSYKELMLMLIKQNSELIEIIKNGTNNTDKIAL